MCLDDSSGSRINTDWVAPGAETPLQEEAIFQLSIMNERSKSKMDENLEEKQRMEDVRKG